MNTFKPLLLVTVVTLFIASCVKVNFDDDGGTGTGNNGDPNETKILTGTIDQSVTLKKGTFTLKGYVYVNNGAILTIEAGTILKSDLSQKGA